MVTKSLAAGARLACVKVDNYIADSYFVDECVGFKFFQSINTLENYRSASIGFLSSSTYYQYYVSQLL